MKRFNLLLAVVSVAFMLNEGSTKPVYSASAALADDGAPETNAATAFPFFDNVEDTTLSKSYWACDTTKWTIQESATLAHSGTKYWSINPSNTRYYLTLAGTLNLTNASNPYVSFWIRDTESYTYYQVQVSNDGGTTWKDLIGQTYFDKTQWTRVQASLAAYRQANVLIRIGSNGYGTFLLDDILIDNAPTPRSLVLLNPTNNGMKLQWTQSTASDFYKYRIVLSTDINNVDVFEGGSSVSGRTERRVLDFFDKARLDTTLTDLVFTHKMYYGKIYEQDTQDLYNQGTDRYELETAFTVTPQVAPFTQDFEGAFQWAADVPWKVTTAAGAEEGHSPTHAWEDSPEGNYVPNFDRCLTFQGNFNTAGRPVLRFKHRYSYDANDYGSVEISADNTAWTDIGSFTGTQGLWRQEEFDLGKLTAFVRFRSKSNGSVEKDGWNLDDVEVYNNTRTTVLPFTDDVEDESAARQKWIAGVWQTKITPGHSGTQAWSINPSNTRYYLTLAGTLNLTNASNPYVSFWIRDTESYTYYQVQVSNDGGTTWKDLIGQTYFDKTQWTRVQASLAAYRQANVLIRIGSNGYGTFLLDDILIDNAPTPRSLVLLNPTNNGMKLQWTQSTASDFYKYRIVLSTDINNVEVFEGESSVTGRTERRVLDFFNKARLDTTLTDLTFTHKMYYGKIYEQDTQDLYNQGTDRYELETAFTVTPQTAPFTQNFEGAFQWAADVPWRLTTAAGAEEGHSPTHAWEDSPDGNYLSNFDRCLTFQGNFNTGDRPVLRFKHRYSYDANDYGSLELSADNLNWTDIGSFTGTQGLWRQEEFDLGKLTAFVRFRSKSNASVEKDGWNLDDVEVYNNTRTTTLPFFDDVEDESAARQKWIGGVWQTKITPGHSGTQAWSINPSSTRYYLTLAGTLNLTNASNPYVSFWIRDTESYTYYQVQVSNDGGTTWKDLIGQTYFDKTQWTRVQASLAAYRQANVLIRIGSNGYGTFLLDDILITEPLSIPTLATPATGSTGQTTTPTLSWNATTGATLYHLQISTDSTFNTNLAFNDSTLTGLSKQVGPLVSDTKYFWHVRAKNPDGASGWSLVWNFRTAASNAPVEVQVLAGWNIVSVPVTAADMSVASLFPGATSSAFGYSNGYTTVTTMNTAKGYWLKFGAARTFSFAGTAVTPKDVPVSVGWNMIGPFETDAATSGITSTPAGVVASNFFGYNNGYTQATTLVHGRGYWIKASQAGTLHLSNTVGKAAEALASVKNTWIRIEIEDRRGTTGILYLAKKEDLPTCAELPPVPPSGVFDVRYDSQTYAESVGNRFHTVVLNSVEYPVQITALNLDGRSLMVRDGVNGSLLHENLEEGKPVTVAYGLSEMVLEEVGQWVEVPLNFELSQNYPNPFNPRTMIKFGLPEGSMVHLSVYNIRGEKVIDLADGYYEAGYHRVGMDAADLQSGTYLYRLEAGRHVTVKKMLILK